jgi:RNA polymerase sigma factor (sigma-70 family)
MSETNDRQKQEGTLVRQARSGDACAFATLVSRYRDKVYATALHYLRGSMDDAQDAAQEAFIQAYLRLPELREPESFGPWLRRLIRNHCLDILRQRRPVSLETLGETYFISDTQAQVDSRLCIKEALDCLSEKTRLTLLLCYVGGCSHDEAAHFLQIPVNTVRSRLQIAKRQLREEMIHMTTDTLRQDAPDPNWTRRIVEEALRRGDEALRHHERGNALQHFNEALAALEEPEAVLRERQRLTLTALQRKAEATRHTGNRDESRALDQRILALAETLGDRAVQARTLQYLATDAANRPGYAPEPLYQKALALYTELGDTMGQGECHLSLGVGRLQASDIAAARQHITEALPLFAQSCSQDWRTVCTSLLSVLEERERLAGRDILLWGAFCYVLTVLENGTVRFTAQPGFQVTQRRDDVPDALFVSSVFWQISHLERIVLEAGVNPGDTRQGKAFSFSNQALQTTVTVLSRDETVSVPAGTFTNCLLTEQKTGAEKQDAGQLNAGILCGTRRAWFAPGVGLVQLSVQLENGTKATLVLENFQQPGDAGESYLPLQPGAAWTYIPQTKPAGFTACEAYRVAEQDSKGRWLLEHYALVSGPPAP